MSSTLLEQTRTNHEEIERLERLIVKDLQTNPTSIKKALPQGHRIRHMIQSIILTTKKLIETYEDKDGSREDEISALGGSQTTTSETTNVFDTFIDLLKEIREYHRKHPCASGLGLVEDYEARLKEEPVIDFCGEEGSCGRYLDLHEMYNKYINSKFGEEVEYSAYLNVFSQLDKIQFKLKFSMQYKKYMEALLGYLINFFRRTEPLQDLDRIFSKVETDFEEQYAGGNIPSQNSVIDLDYYKTVEELIDVGPEKLKEALGALGLKVGGTVKQRAERLFLTKHTPLEKLDKKHFSKQESETAKEIALKEAKEKKLCVLLDETIERTKQYVVKKQSWTYEEMEEERRENAESESRDDEEEEEEEDGQIHNPLKLPMGWDGKPIPFWLYNLHGLGHEFKCEICADCIYKGRRAFEMHFKERQHQSGMRSLGIPNTKDFKEITLIEEAKALWKKIQERQGENKWKPEVEEEFEDQEGNIYNKKTYSDLQRQGLI